ncbi:MAG: hypothetical protein NW202_13275, partial [Nitrospira sp.]|nr:hypothetical protein [Nitrospira sp.]
MKKIETLTVEQVAIMRDVAREWIERESTWRPVNVGAVANAIPLLYRNMTVPRAIIVASSPWHANKIANVHDNVRNNVRNNVVNNVYDNVADNVRNNV